ncbi:MAG: chemotaxis protein CheX [Myxococcales bacterium FL481]|nr:MAG: chemotaxis protein CheX [Myxococcales bacterium FL481]
MPEPSFSSSSHSPPMISSSSSEAYSRPSPATRPPMVTLEALTEVAIAGLGECIETLGYEGLELGSTIETIPEGMVGGYIRLAGEGQDVQLGIVSSLAGCQSLAGTMLALDPEEDDPLPEDELWDALGELSNIFAGSVKTRLSHAGMPVKIGLPTACDGSGESPTSERSCLRSIKIGTVEAVVSVGFHDAAA